MYGREATTADRKGFTRDPSRERLGKFEKMERFADWLRTSDGHEAYMELKAEIDAAKNKLLKN